MAGKDPAASAAKWASRLSSATQEIADGVSRVTENPGAAALRAKPKMVARWTAAMSQGGKWDASMQKTTLAGWQAAMVQKGIPRISGGAQAAQPKMADFLTKLIAYQQANVGAIKAMPGLTIDDGANRAAAWVKLMGKFKK